MKKKVLGAVLLAAIVNPTFAADGRAVYERACAACHEAGVFGAPRVGDRRAWSQRIAKGEVVLIRHSLEGFRGDKGFMPARGGDQSLDDRDVEAAVRYMMEQSW